MRTGRITVPLDGSEAAALWEMAEADCRTPHDQIRYLLRQSAQERGLISEIKVKTAEGDRRVEQPEKVAA